MLRSKVLLADDHTIVAQGLGRLLQDEFDLVATVANGLDLLAVARETRPDVIVADVSMPGLSGLDALRRLRADGIHIKVIFLTMHADPSLASEGLRAGASGYLLKHNAGDELIQAIREVLVGGVYLTPLLATDIVKALAAPQTLSARNLTPRQRQVLNLVAEGRSIKEIAVRLRLSRRTVETHKYALMDALGLHTTAELIRFAIEHDLGAVDRSSCPLHH
jgi:DNA-binding NarL/FixJ family response regulator